MPPPLRLVLDTNVVVAALLWTGPPRTLLDAALQGRVELLTSAALLDELERTLLRSKFTARIQAFGTGVDALVSRYAAMTGQVSPFSVPRVVSGDADDDHVIAAAVAARAHLIATGDRKHLLPIGSHRGIAIVTPREAVAYLDATQHR